MAWASMKADKVAKRDVDDWEYRTLKYEAEALGLKVESGCNALVVTESKVRRSKQLIDVET